MPDRSQSLVIEFYRQQHRALISFLQSKLGSEQEANDVAQQTYERLLNNSKTEAVNNPPTTTPVTSSARISFNTSSLDSDGPGAGLVRLQRKGPRGIQSCNTGSPAGGYVG